MKEWLPCQFQSLVPQRNPVYCSIYFHLILLTSLHVQLGQRISSEFVIFRAIRASRIELYKRSDLLHKRTLSGILGIFDIRKYMNICWKCIKNESYAKEVICFTNGLCLVYWAFLISGNTWTFAENVSRMADHCGMIIQ